MGFRMACKTPEGGMVLGEASLFTLAASFLSVIFGGQGHVLIVSKKLVQKGF